MTKIGSTSGIGGCSKLKVAADLSRRSGVLSAGDRPVELDAGQQVEFVGEVGGAAKEAFLGRGQGALFPIDWPEPFGLVMIEAMACGTPVVAFRRESVPEVMTEGVTGFVVDDVAGAVAAVARVAGLDRRLCRAVFERRFDAAIMVRNYLDVYDRLIAEHEGC